MPPEFETVQIGDLDRDSLSHNGRGMVIRVKWLGKDFALKRLTKSSTTAEAEAIILAANQHPHVVQLMCHWNKRTEDFITYMLMEKMDGDISKLMDQRKAQDIVPPFSLLESVDIMLQVAKAMRFLHSKGVAHRDLKCRNILWKHGQFDHNYMSFSRPSLSRASSLIRTHPFRRRASSLIRALFRRHPIARYTALSDDGGNELEILYEDIPFDFAPLLDDTRLVFILLYAL